MKGFFDPAIEEKLPEYLSALKRLVRIESIEGKEEPGAPFGPGPRMALEEALQVARAWGFDTHTVSDAVGYAEWINDQTTEDYVGILGHVDVVPAGTGWTYPSFDTTIIGDKVFGRGVLDNKGPILASLFAVKLLKDSGMPFQKNARIIFGTNEETGSKDLPYYLEQAAPPVYGFTPDSQFPAVYGEKGIVGLRFTSSFEGGRLDGIRDIQGEFISSSVPDQAVVVFEDGTTKEFQGRRAPSNEPQLGENALTLAAHEMKTAAGLSTELQRYFSWLSETFHEKHHGEGFTRSAEPLEAMDLQFTPYSLKKEGNKLVLDLSIRYAIDVQEAQILELVNEHLFPRTKVDVTRSMPPHVFDRTHPMLDTMKRAYEEVTGLDGTPIVTTGATYARFMPNILAFGPSFPGQVGIAHNRDEYMYLDDLKRNIQIYLLVLKEMLQ